MFKCKKYSFKELQKEIISLKNKFTILEKRVDKLEKTVFFDTCHEVLPEIDAEEE